MLPGPWGAARIIPLLVIDQAEDVLPVTEALAEGGIKVFEIGLRTPAAIEAIRLAVRGGVGTVAAGTVTNATQLRQVIDAGAEFGVSPAFTPSLSKAVVDNKFPFIPGIGSVSEALAALEAGFSHQKLYPADLLGAEKFAKSLASVLPEISLMPSGGVGEHNLQTYLSQPNVFAVSGSWLAPQALVAERRFDEIRDRAREALELVP